MTATVSFAIVVGSAPLYVRAFLLHCLPSTYDWSSSCPSAKLSLSGAATNARSIPSHGSVAGSAANEMSLLCITSTSVPIVAASLSVRPASWSRASFSAVRNAAVPPTAVGSMASLGTPEDVLTSHVATLIIRAPNGAKPVGHATLAGAVTVVTSVRSSPKVAKCARLKLHMGVSPWTATAW